MNKTRAGIVQQIFLAALERPAEDRDHWLKSQWGHDPSLLAEVRSLLAHAEPSVDVLEQDVDKAVADMPQWNAAGNTRSQDGAEEADEISGEEFLSRLSDVGILSSEELSSASDSIQAGHPSNEPRQLASQLVADGKLTPYQASALLKGEPELLIDKYLILDLIDVGGMGMVFKAIHRTMNRVVALKMISHQALASIEQIKRFRREVQVAATLEHPNIVRAYDADEARGLHFLVMEYVRGDNLNRVVQANGPLSLSKAVDYIRQAAIALDYAHNRGVVHRDIKPGNLLLDRSGTIKVLDLGLAHFDDALQHPPRSPDKDGEENEAAVVTRSELTAAGSILGTASFMAPEQSLDSHLADRRSDIYSLGCTLYYLLTGETPYPGNTIFQVFVQHREGEIPSLRSKRADVPESLESVYRRMVAKEPKDRFQSIQELLAALEACRIAPPQSVAAPKRFSTTDTEAGDTRTGKRALLIASLVGIALLSIAGIMGWTDWTEHAKDRYTASPQSGTTSAPAKAGKMSGALIENLGPAINSPSFELSGDMTGDQLLVVFCSAKEGSSKGTRDLWVATRPSKEAHWNTAERLPTEINTEDSEQLPEISADGLRLRFQRGSRWMISTRADRDAVWNEATADPDALGLRQQYKLTPDGLTAIRPGRLSTDRGNGSGIMLMEWQRASLDAPFGEIREFFIPTEKPIRNFGAMSDDGLVYLFGMESESKNAGSELFITTRPDRNSDWSSPSPLFPDSTISANIPVLLRDGKSFLFHSNRNDGYGASDLWLGQLIKTQ